VRHGPGFRLLGALALLGFAGSAVPLPAQSPNLVEAGGRTALAEPQPEPRPAIWLIEDEDTKIYLFGTFHILPPGFRWRSPQVDSMIAEADELVLEVAEEEDEIDAFAILERMSLGKQAPILWRVSPDRREALREMIEATGTPVEMFDHLHTWAAAMAIAVTMIVREYGGADAGDIGQMPGVEDALHGIFREAGRPISGVETSAEQMGFFGAMSFAEQRRMLEDMVDAWRAGESSADISELDWVQGNVEALGIDREDMPESLYEALITRRNAAWTLWLQERLERPGTVLFAVGAGHLTGPDSVQTMLEARGMTVRRIDR